MYSRGQQNPGCRKNSASSWECLPAPFVSCLPAKRLDLLCPRLRRRSSFDILQDSSKCLLQRAGGLSLVLDYNISQLWLVLQCLKGLAECLVIYIGNVECRGDLTLFHVLG